MPTLDRKTEIGVRKKPWHPNSVSDTWHTPPLSMSFVRRDSYRLSFCSCDPLRVPLSKESHFHQENTFFGIGLHLDVKVLTGLNDVHLEEKRCDEVYWYPQVTSSPQQFHVYIFFLVFYRGHSPSLRKRILGHCRLFVTCFTLCRNKLCDQFQQMILATGVHLQRFLVSREYMTQDPSLFEARSANIKVYLLQQLEICCI